MRSESIRRNAVISLTLTLTLIIFSFPSWAGETIGSFSRVEGTVDVMRGGALPAIPAKTGDAVQVGDFVRTKSNAQAEVTFKDGNILKIAQRTRIDISEYLAGTAGDSRKLSLPRGKVQAVVNKGAGDVKQNRFEIHTPNAVAGVRGTDFFVFHDRNVTGVLVKSGAVYTYNRQMPNAVVTVPAGAITTIAEKGLPQPPRPATDAEKTGFDKEMAAKQKPDDKSAKKEEKAAVQEKVINSIGPVAGNDRNKSPDGQNIPTTKTGPTGDDPPPPPVFQPPPPPPPPPSIIVHPPPPPPPPPPIIPPPLPTPTPPTFEAPLNVDPMYRGSNIDPNKNLLTIIKQGPMNGIIKSTHSLWGASSIPFALAGIYAGPTAKNHYWQTDVGSHNYNTGGVTTYDNGTWRGFAAGSDRDGAGVFNGHLAAIYVDPAGKAGLMTGAFNGALGSGAWSGNGAFNILELNPSTGVIPASIPNTWWASNTVSPAIPTIKAPPLTGNKNYSAEGFLLDGSLNMSEKLADRGDELKLTLFKPDPAFGVWQRESSGSFAGSNSDVVLITDVSVGAAVNGFGRTIPDTVSNVVSLGKWGANGSITGKAYGFWGDWASGAAWIMSGVVNGSYNYDNGTSGHGAFGAISSGGFLSVARFLALAPAERVQVGFPGIQSTTTLNLSWSNGLGSSVSLSNIRLFSHSSGDPISLWATDSVSGSLPGGPQEGQQIALESSDSQQRATFRIEHAGTSTSGNVWLAKISGIGELGGTTPFRSSFEGIAAGTYSGSTFTGTAAGISHPITYFSILGSQNMLTHFNGSSYQTAGSLYGAFGGMSLWNSSSALLSDFEIVGVHLPSTLGNSDYVFSTDFDSFDIPTGASTTADGGAYRGYLTGSLSNSVTSPTEPINGRINALYISPTGKAGILTGKFTGYLDQNGSWESHGGWYPVELASSVGGGVTASSLLPANISTFPFPVPLNTAQTGFFIGTGGSINTTASITGNNWDMARISNVTDWGIWKLTTAGIYSNPTYNQWVYDLANINDGTRFLDGIVNGDKWSVTDRQLRGDLYAGWADTSSTVPITGILVGELIGTFDPGAYTWQAIGSGAWLETTKFLQLASTASGQATLQKLNIPAFEIGSADFSGSGGVSVDTINVNISNAKFFAPTNGSRPVIWATGNVGGSYTGNPLTVGPVSLTQSGGTNSSGLAPTFDLKAWNGGKWGAAIVDSSGSGAVGSHSGIKFSGKGAGSYSGGTFSGTAAGGVK